jgi:hypothetical protein
VSHNHTIAMKVAALPFGVSAWATPKYARRQLRPLLPDAL